MGTTDVKTMPDLHHQVPEEVGVCADVIVDQRRERIPQKIFDHVRARECKQP